MHEHTESFMKTLFSGGFEEDVVFSYPEMSKDEQDNLNLVMDSVKQFMLDNVDPAKIDKESVIPPEVIEGMKELGLFGLIIPEEYGGFEFSQTAYAKIIELMSGLEGSTALTIGGHSSIGIKALLLFGTDEQKKKYLPRLATGELIAAFALTEPGAGSDAASIKTRAVYNADDDSYTLTGSKLWITNGGIADFITTFARTEIEVDGKIKDKLSAFIVTRDMGYTSGVEEEKMGIKGSSTTEINFNGVVVPASNMLGEKGKGFKVAMEVLNSGRLSLAAGSIGGMKECISLATTHALERKQFGKSISEFEMIKEKIARMSMEIFVCDSMTYLTTGLADRGSVDYSLESAMGKVFASEALWRTVNEAMQIAAGIGYMKEYPYERILRDSRINMIFEGTNEILRLFIALAGMQDQGEYLKKIGKALRDPIKGFGLLTDYAVARIKRSMIAPEITKAHPVLNVQVKKVREYVRKFQGIVEEMIIKHGKNIIEQELVLKRIADISIDLYAMIATISRVTSLIESKGEDKCLTEIHITETFCEEAWRRIRRNAAMTKSNQDNYINAIAESTYKSMGYNLG